MKNILLAITGTNNENNLNITRGTIVITPINTHLTDYDLRGSVQFISGLGNDTAIQTRFGILAPNAVPETPLLLNPKNNTFFNYSLIEFRWSAEDQNNDTLTSLFELFNNTIFTQVYDRNDSLEQTVYSVAIPEDITLYWRVRTNDSSDNSSFSEEFTVTRDSTLPTSFNLTTPANNTEDTDTTPE